MYCSMRSLQNTEMPKEATKSGERLKRKGPNGNVRKLLTCSDCEPTIRSERLQRACATGAMMLFSVGSFSADAGEQEAKGRTIGFPSSRGE